MRYLHLIAAVGGMTLMGTAFAQATSDLRPLSKTTDIKVSDAAVQLLPNIPVDTCESIPLFNEPGEWPRDGLVPNLPLNCFYLKKQTLTSVVKAGWKIAHIGLEESNGRRFVDEHGNSTDLLHDPKARLRGREKPYHMRIYRIVLVRNDM